MSLSSPDPYQPGVVVLTRKAWSPIARSAVVIQPPSPDHTMIVQMRDTNHLQRIRTPDVVAVLDGGDWRL